VLMMWAWKVGRSHTQTLGPVSHSLDQVSNAVSISVSKMDLDVLS